MEEWVKVYGDYKKKELRNMCWITSKKENSKGLIAKTDIPILKVLGRNGITPIMDFHIPFNEKLPQETIKEYLIYLTLWRIDNGYHSYSADGKIVDSVQEFCLILKNGYFSPTYSHKYNIYNGYIPKGTLYYENGYGEIVSETLVVTNESRNVDYYNISGEINVLIDDGNGKLILKYVTLKDIIDYRDNVKGIICRDDSNTLSDYYFCISMMDEDWLVGQSENSNEFAKKYGGYIETQMFNLPLYLYDYFIQDISKYFYIRESIGGNVDYNSLYYDFQDHTFRNIYNTIREEEGNGYVLPIVKIPKNIVKISKKKIQF